MIGSFRLASPFVALMIGAAAPLAAHDAIYPPDNPPSPIKVELGRRLFYEADLSINGTMACATCHEQRRGFADGNRTHPGALDHPGKRNVPGLQNVALLSHFTWASRTPDLEHQALRPLLGESPIEMGMKGQEAELARRLAANACYVKLFSAAFPEKKGEISLTTVTRALATFERALVSFDSPYDKAARDGQPLPADAEAGRALFKGKGGCETCHSGPNFTDDAFHALEHFQAKWTPVRVKKMRENKNLEPRFDSIKSGNALERTAPADRGLTDQGLADESGRTEDAGLFRTPGLRNAAVTAPYFHDGKARTLPDAIRRHGLPFALSDAEMDEIATFLASLTDGGSQGFD
jgi:cytochrome c peroxidase